LLNKIKATTSAAYLSICLKESNKTDPSETARPPPGKLAIANQSAESCLTMHVMGAYGSIGN